MKIEVNGREIVFYKTMVQDLLDQYGMNPKKIVVEKNGEVVHRENYKIEELADGDVVEIARFVGGG